ncbi:hypothetical protein AB1N83_010779 [Pleurotus pulmonarius]
MGIIEVDDRDARIVYSYGWGLGGSPPDYNHTVSTTTTQGAQFTFVFLGTSIGVFGTLAESTFPNTSYTIDDGEPFIFFGEPPPKIRYRQNFFSSPNLTYGEHILVGTCVDEGGLVHLDYLEVETPAPSTTLGSSDSQPVASLPATSQLRPSTTASSTISSSAVPLAPTTLPLPSTTVTNWGSLPSDMSAPPSLSNSNPKPTPSVAAIIGCVVGGFALGVFSWAAYGRYRLQSRKSVALMPRRQSLSSMTSLGRSA